jgi:hypothetical protein
LIESCYALERPRAEGSKAIENPRKKQSVIPQLLGASDMPTLKVTLVRDETSINGMNSRNRASTDSINAIRTFCLESGSTNRTDYGSWQLDDSFSDELAVPHGNRWKSVWRSALEKNGVRSSKIEIV